MSEPIEIQKPKSLKEQYVPFEKRESQNIKSENWLKDLLIIGGFSALGALIGRIGGSFLEPSIIKLNKFTINQQTGTWIGGKIGALYGVFKYWQKREGRQIAVESLNSDLKEAISPEHLQKESVKEQEIIDGIKYLQNKGDMSYRNYIDQRRENAEHSLGLTGGK